MGQDLSEPLPGFLVNIIKVRNITTNRANLCLYALKYLKDSGAALRYPVRALLGANEETGMADVDYYAAHFEMPAFCFTPDAEAKWMQKYVIVAEAISVIFIISCAIMAV